jgi:integrase/recombinase XerD
VEVNTIGVAEARRFIFHLQNEVVRWQDHPFTKDDKPLSPFTVHRYARSIRAFWSWLYAEGYILENPMVKMKLPRLPRKIIATFTKEQIRKMIAKLNLKTAMGFRNFVIILLLLDTGLRLSELTGIRLSDIDFKQSYLTVMGKGGKERIVPFGTQVRRVLWRYISIYRNGPYSSENDYLLQTSMGAPVRRNGVRLVILRLGRIAGISGIRCSAHTFRHTFAKEYLLQGGDIFSLQHILGHNSLEMVRNYVNLVASDVSRQHRKYSPVDNVVLQRRKLGS